MRRAITILSLACMFCACQREPAAELAHGEETPIPTPVRTEQPAPAAVPLPKVEASPAAAQKTSPVIEGIPRKIPMPVAGVPTPALAPVVSITYVCENGSPMRVSYEGIVARIAWTEGRQLTLSRNAGEGETYAGEGYVLLRRGSVVQLSQQGGVQSWRCEESASSA